MQLMHSEKPRPHHVLDRILGLQCVSRYLDQNCQVHVNVVLYVSMCWLMTLFDFSGGSKIEEILSIPWQVSIKQM